MSPKPIIFDCDPGDDDAVALIMAMASAKDLDILGITTSSGNVPVELTFSNARKICALAGRPEIPVYKGCETPLFKAPFYAHYIHGESGLDGHSLSDPSTPIETKHAVDFIIETLLSSPEKITLAVTGPMTNVALALMKEPSIKTKIDQVVMMGGSRTEMGNVTPCAEFNMFVDPHAAFKVLQSLDSIVMIGLDVTHRLTLTETALDYLKSLKTYLSDVIYNVLLHSHEADKKIYGLPGRAIHDAAVTAYLLRPDLFKGRRSYVTVETTSEKTMGQTIVHWYPMHNQEKTPNCLFINEINGAAVLNLILEKIKIQSDATKNLEKAV